MNILFDLSHPAHVHFFKNAYRILIKRGHNVKIAARDKDVTLQLLKDLDIPHQAISKIGKGLIGLGIELLQHETRLGKIARDFRADVILEIGGTFIVHAGKLLGIKTIVFTDTEHAKLSNMITFPFADYICTPESYHDDIGKKHIRYNGYQELAYLHPNYFRPNPSVLSELGIRPSERYFILRFVSWGASHDIGKKGISAENKIKLVQGLEKIGRVLITSESRLPDVLKSYQISVSPIHIHDLLYFAHMYIGEGATMATEAALMGTPSIYINPLGSGNLSEIIERYRLMVHITDGNIAYDQIIDLAASKNLEILQKSHHEDFINEKIDVTKWMVELIESLG